MNPTQDTHLHPRTASLYRMAPSEDVRIFAENQQKTKWRGWMIQDLSTAISRRYCGDLSEMKVLEVVRNALQDVDDSEKRASESQTKLTWISEQTRAEQDRHFQQEMDAISKGQNCDAAMSAIGDH